MSFKVLHIVSGDLWGGAEAQMSMQIPAQQRAGLEVTVLCFNELRTAQRFRQEGVEVSVVEESQGLLGLLRASLALTRSFSPSVVVSHGYKESIVAAYVSRRFGCAWFVWFHGLSEGYRGAMAFKNGALQGLQRIMAKVCADRLFVVSKDAARKLGLNNNSSMRVIYNVFEQSTGNVSTPGIELQHPAVVVVGRLTEIKRIDRAIAAFARVVKEDALADARLYIVGEGPLESELRKQVVGSQCEAAIEFLGFRSDAAEIIGQADVLLITSDSEGVPTVLLEALSQQIPIVSTAVGGIPEVAELFSEYPMYLARCDAVDIASGIVSIVSRERETREEWRRTYEQSFLPDVAAKQFLDELQVVCERKADQRSG